MTSVRNLLLSAAYYPFKWAASIGRHLGISSSDSLRVLLYHDIAPEEQRRFADQIRWLTKSWTFVSPEQFGAMVSREEPIRGRNLLLTFDDGFASNRTVAEEVLNPLGIRALFFIVSDFVSQEDRASAHQFIARHIRPGTRVADLPSHICNMGWSDLEALLEQGHSIGAHTRTHSRLSAIHFEPELSGEIVESADMIAARLRVPIEHFAYTFGDLASFSAAGLTVARRRFRFVHSGLRGDNVSGASPFALRRESVAPSDPKTVVGAFMEGAADFQYAKARTQLDAWAGRQDTGGH